MNDSTSTEQKALRINLDERLYGTFAEIGAGQEVARHFFVAGKASSTVAKTMSAYDMTFSDAIYGKESRYVCAERLEKMLEHEFNLLIQRLSEKRGDQTQFFVFADTVATQSAREDGHKSRSHGWLGVRFQSAPMSEPSDIIIHVKLWDRNRLQQQDALSVLGVNLLHSAFYGDSTSDRLEQMVDQIGTERVEIDMIRFSGPAFEGVDNREVALAMVQKGLTEAVLFNPKGEFEMAADSLFRKNLLVQRGTFRPVTSVNIDILKRGTAQFESEHSSESEKPLALAEMNIHKELTDGTLDFNDFVNRSRALSSCGYHVLISKFPLFYQLKAFLRECTNGHLCFLIGASLLEGLFNSKYYEPLRGGALEAFGRLFDDKSQILVFPWKTEKICLTTQSFSPEQKLTHLYRHLTEIGCLRDLANCDDIDTTIQSQQVRLMIKAQEKGWENFVPEPVLKLIHTGELKL